MFANALASGLYSGQTTGIAWGVSGKSTAVESIIAGSVWACYTIGTNGITMTGGLGYCTAGANTVYYTQIAILTARAT